MKQKKIEDIMKSEGHNWVQPNLSRKQLNQISLSDECKSIIYGTLLGDGCFQRTKGDKKARLSIRHSDAQKEYFDWKVEHLQPIASAKSVQIQAPNGYSTKQKLLFQSRAIEPLTNIMSITYEKNKLRIRRRWLNHLTAQSLAIWWCDDGSIISLGRKGVLCTDGFDEASVRLLANYLKTVWNVYAHVGPISRNRKYGDYTQTHYYRLWFGTEQLKSFLRIILPHIPVASMLYKTLLVYKHSLFQQRWISEMKLALPQFADEIDALLKSRVANIHPSEEP